ncbi:MAG TPA: hypothetical protein VFY83_02815 [Anaerolineales bacterium]|nr:hypothetical protein [Anaerolineales bacterium]
MNGLKKLPVLILLLTSFMTFACVYVVLPEGLDVAGAAQGTGNGVWNAMVTNVGTSEAGDLHVDITIRNDTGDWSTMRAVPDQSAILTTGDGKTVSCGTVFIGTGGHRLAPGFQMRGYTTGDGNAPEVQTLYVECKGATASAGSTLSIPYESFTGILDDYDPEANRKEGVLELSLDEVAADLTYPIAAPVDGLIQEAGTSITALSDNVVTLLDAQRTENGFQFTWQNFNPTKFPLKTHIGTPPVIGADGIIYGVYETLDIVPVDITPANENMQWTTEVTAPQDVNGFYILLSVESKKPRTYLNYALDITDK